MINSPRLRYLRATATRNTAMVPEICFVTLGSYQFRRHLSTEQGGVVRHLGLREVASSTTSHVPLGTWQFAAHPDKERLVAGGRTLEVSTQGGGSIITEFTYIPEGNGIFKRQSGPKY
ncbi:Uncharacterized protein HZ326_19157 [Fusarium oxysporum f. sp. albedinis]|nr:Uncharacterized protein HZ326_19157 [Fusarium oxysporum f. sp. albedinis]